MNGFGKVSIIVPVYNVETCLDQCVKSLVGQTYDDLQIILIDDGSPDRSGYLCDLWANQDNRITVIHKTNEGLSAARNDGLHIASGKYCCFVDSDDWMDIDAVSKAVSAAESEAADIVFFPYVRETISNSTEVHFYDGSCSFYGTEIQDQLVRRLIGPIGNELSSPGQMDWRSTAWAKIYHTESLKANELSFTDLSKIGTFEDGLFNIRAFSYAKTVVYLDECLYHYRRMNSGQLTSAYRLRFFEQTEYLYSLLERMPEVRSVPHGQEALQNRIALNMSAQALSIVGSRCGFLSKIKAVHSILHSDRSRAALQQLNIREMPFLWKAFYWSCKTKNVSATLFLAEIMLHLKKLHNR